jgi:hypothetical protein
MDAVGASPGAWEVKLSLPPFVEFQHLAMDACWSVTGGLRLDDKLRRNLQQVLREVFLGAVRRAVPPSNLLPIELIFRVTDLRLELVVRERGMPFGDDGAHVDGLLQAQKFVDAVQVANLGREGTETVFSLHLQRESVRRFLSRSELLAEEKVVPPSRKAAFVVRTLRFEDALEVSRCAYLSYGYSYLHDDIYYPERIRAANKEGRLHSLLCVTSDTGEIMGHAALKPFRGKGFGELVMAFVKPEFRGNKCLETLTQCLVQEAERQGLGGVFVNSVTTHSHSQRAARSFGLSECALLLSRLVPMNFEGFVREKEEREALLMAFRLFDASRREFLHIPERHSPMIGRLFSSIGIEVVGVSPGTAPLTSDKTEMTLTTDSQGTAQIQVHFYGKNAPAELDMALRGLCLQRVETVYLSLPLRDPGTPLFLPVFEKMHFFFCGIEPDFAGDHRLLMQFLNNQVVNYAAIKMDSQLGCDLLEYVQRNDPFRDFGNR